MNEQRYLIFGIGGEKYALAFGCTAEIMELPTVYPLPKAPVYYLGIVNVHNRPVPVLDLALMRGSAPSGGRREILVIGGKDVNLALLADGAIDIASGDFPVEPVTDSDCTAEKQLMLDTAAIKLIEPESLLDKLEKDMNNF
ncbi:MAG TPA: chemotaxis protein CheW [Geobacteraceae bacterium]|nr:chemotaxis protein CheW [Geobacteraceae bacterium]